ncbi:MAG: UDP-glucose 4-epimerase GalE [bacterium]
MSQILVSGGCGYIGSHIVKLLSEKGESVVVFDNLSQGSKDFLLYGEELVVGDICDKDALKKLFATHDIEAVIHMAALVNAAESVQKADEYKTVNDQGSRNVWEAAVAAGVKHLLYASSAAVYGTPDTRDPLPETAQLHPDSPYGATKLAGEASLHELADKTSNYIAFRFFNVGGAEEEGRLGQSKGSRAIMQRLFAVAAGDDDQITISGHDYDTPDGTVIRDFIHVEDIAFAFILGLNYLRQSKASVTLNLGSGESHTIGEVIKEVGIVTGKTIPLIYGPRMPGDISFSLSDISLAKKILGWEPANTLRLTVRDGWNSYVKRNA